MLLISKQFFISDRYVHVLLIQPCFMIHLFENGDSSSIFAALDDEITSSGQDVTQAHGIQTAFIALSDMII